MRGRNLGPVDCVVCADLRAASRRRGTTEARFDDAAHDAPYPVLCSRRRFASRCLTRSMIASAASTGEHAVNGKYPLPGEDGYLERLHAAFEAGHVTEGERHQLSTVHQKLVVELAA